MTCICQTLCELLQHGVAKRLGIRMCIDREDLHGSPGRASGLRLRLSPLCLPWSSISDVIGVTRAERWLRGSCRAGFLQNCRCRGKEPFAGARVTGYSGEITVVSRRFPPPMLGAPSRAISERPYVGPSLSAPSILLRSGLRGGFPLTAARYLSIHWCSGSTI